MMDVTSIAIAGAGLALNAGIALMAMGSFKGTIKTALEGTNTRLADLKEDFGKRIDDVKASQDKLGDRISDAERDLANLRGQIDGHARAAAETALLKIKHGNTRPEL